MRPNNEPRLRALLTKLASHGRESVVVDRTPPSTHSQSPSPATGCLVGDLPGPTLRRIADLYPSKARTDARTMLHALRDLEPYDEIITALYILPGGGWNGGIIA